MPNTGNTVNPTSTTTVPSPGGRGSSNSPNDYRFVMSGSGTATITIETEAFPCAFDLFSNNTSVPNYGRLLCYSASSVDVVSAGGVDDGAVASANRLGVALSSGVLTLSAHGTFPANTVVRVTRVI